jgi:hypothetical protein
MPALPRNLRQDSRLVLRRDCERWNLEVRRVERKWDDVEVRAGLANTLPPLPCGHLKHPS